MSKPIGNPECSECGGLGKVVIRWEPTFNVSLMEVHAKEILGPCDCVTEDDEPRFQLEDV